MRSERVVSLLVFLTVVGAAFLISPGQALYLTGLGLLVLLTGFIAGRLETVNARYEGNYTQKVPGNGRNR